MEHPFFRLICESLLEHEQMVYKNSKPFVRTFQLIRKIVGGVDYKVSWTDWGKEGKLKTDLKVFCYYTNIFWHAYHFLLDIFIITMFM